MFFRFDDSIIVELINQKNLTNFNNKHLVSNTEINTALVLQDEGSTTLPLLGLQSCLYACLACLFSRVAAQKFGNRDAYLCYATKCGASFFGFKINQGMLIVLE